MGNGAAMRVAPIGAYFADDLDKVLYYAQASAEVTHAHIEGIVGAMAVAVASALLLIKRWGIIWGKEIFFCVILQGNYQKATQNIKYCLRLLLKRKVT